MQNAEQNVSKNKSRYLKMTKPRVLCKMTFYHIIIKFHCADTRLHQVTPLALTENIAGKCTLAVRYK